MINLNKLVKLNQIKSNGERIQLSVATDDININTLNVYNIPIYYTSYNIYNGRIASLMSSPDNKEKLKKANNYNEAIGGLIEKSNLNKFKKTVNSIKEQGQLVDAIVLNNGVVIDGNRRAAAIRKISKNNGKKMYLKAAILPFNGQEKDEKKYIRTLELSYQLAIEPKVTYSPLDLAVYMYSNIVIDKAFTINEFSNKSRFTPKEIKNNIKCIKLIKSFLKFINYNSLNDYSIISNHFTMFSEFIKSMNKNKITHENDIKLNREAYFMTILSTFINPKSHFKNKFTREHCNSIISSSYDLSFSKELMEKSIKSIKKKFSHNKINNEKELLFILNDSQDEFYNYNLIFNKYNHKAEIEHHLKSISNNINDAKIILSEMNDSDDFINNITKSDNYEQNVKSLFNINESSSSLIKKLFYHKN